MIPNGSLRIRAGDTLVTVKRDRIACKEEEENGSGGEWSVLIERARAVLHPREISPFVEAGGVAAAILTEAGNVYVGVCIDTACSLGMCAERNAAANMITNGEHRIKKLVCIMGDGKAGMPCGACRELLMQLSPENAELQILADCETEKAVSLKELVPDWWGKSSFLLRQRPARS